MTDITKGLVMNDMTHSIIMVAGVGGAGGNALNHMVEMGINGVIFMACNTDAQALDQSKASIKVQLGSGLGAGNVPERGSQAAKESIDDIINILRSEGIKMLFITAGMGGGTGTGASPIIAKAAQELGILTVAIVTTPYSDEGPLRTEQAQVGIDELKQYTDSMLVLSNDSIEELYGDLPMFEGFWKADDVLTSAVKGIAEIITGHGIVNVDYGDVSTVMKDSGRAFMGSGKASGDNRAAEAAEASVTSLLLNYRDITGAKKILLNISYGDKTVTQREAGIVRGYLQQRTGGNANIIWGTAYKPSLGEELELTIVATGLPVDADDVISVPRPSTPRKEPYVPQRPEYNPNPHPTERPPRSPFTPPTATPSDTPRRQPESGVVQWKGTDRYADIDNIVTTPTWVRNKAELTNPHEGRPTSKTSFKDRGATEKEEAPKTKPGSLFDIPDES